MIPPTEEQAKEYGDLNHRAHSIIDEHIQRAKSHYEEVKHPNIEEAEEAEENKG